MTERELVALKREAVRLDRTVSQIVRKRALKGLDVALVPVGEGEQSGPDPWESKCIGPANAAKKVAVR